MFHFRIPPYTIISEKDIEEVFIYSVTFSNAVHTTSLPLYGTGNAPYFIYFDIPKQKFEFQKTMKVTFGCDLDFNTYPFDHHSCDFDYGFAQLYHYSPINGTKFSKLEPVMILNKENATPELLVGSKPIPNQHLPFEFTMAPKESFSLANVNFFSPFTGITITFRRKTLGLLLTSYFIPTATFAMLSMVSYFISPDVVRIQKKKYLCQAKFPNFLGPWQNGITSYPTFNHS